jgi:hypothetical protein
MLSLIIGFIMVGSVLGLLICLMIKDDGLIMALKIFISAIILAVILIIGVYLIVIGLMK